MADVFWSPRQKSRPQVTTITVGTASPGGTITVTVGGTRTVVITPTTTNTTTTATELAAALAASTEGEFTELGYGSALAVVTITGPDDGAPFTISKADGGSNVTTLATTASLSPHDVTDPVNYSTGLIPAAAERLVFQDTDVSALYRLDGLVNAITVLVRDTFTGSVGLPDTNANGYPENRRTFLDVDATALTVELAAGAQAGQFRFEVTSASACTVTITGDGAGAGVGQEVVEFYGTITASVLNVAGASAAVAPKVGQTAHVSTFRGLDGTIHFGSGVTLGSAAGPTLQNCTALVECSWSNTLAMDGGEVTVGRAAAGLIAIDAGRCVWKSTGNPGNSPVIGGGGELDLSRAPATLTVGGTALLYAGGTITDPAGRGGNMAVQLVRCTLQEVQWVTPSNKTLTLS